MAGKGSRFSNSGYIKPKPLIEVHGRPMIEQVIKNLKPNTPHKFTFICQEEHLNRFNLEENISNATNSYNIITIKELTEGAACTVLLAEKIIDNQNQLMIANCDQYISVDINKYIESFLISKSNGYIMTMKANDPKWSFVKLNSLNLVTDVKEKEVVSDEATVGIYNFLHGNDFVYGAKKMISKNERVNNEFYVAPVYNNLINDNFKVGIFNIGSDRDGMFGLGVPEDLEYFNSLGALPRK